MFYLICLTICYFGGSRKTPNAKYERTENFSFCFSPFLRNSISDEYCHQQYFLFPLRRMFVDKFLLWKVFPLCSLRLVLHFAVLEKPPAISEQIKDKNSYQLLETVRCLAVVWSNKDFVQSASIEQQACIL